MDSNLRGLVMNRIKTLEEQRLRIELKIEVLHEILSGGDVSLGDIALPPSRQPAVTSGHTNGSSGLRATLVSVLSASGPLTRKQAIARVQDAGFKPKGKTPIPVLVTGELYRLTRTGTLRKHDDGTFSVTGKGA